MWREWLLDPMISLPLSLQVVDVSILVKKTRDVSMFNYQKKSHILRQIWKYDDITIHVLRVWHQCQIFYKFDFLYKLDNKWLQKKRILPKRNVRDPKRPRKHNGNTKVQMTFIISGVVIVQPP